MKYFFILFMFIWAGLSAQDLKIVSGNYDFLRGQKEIAVDLHLENASFQNEKYTEQQYTDIIKSTISNNPKKNSTDLAKWESDWKAYRDGGFLDAFLDGINKKTSPSLTFSKATNAKYTLIVDTKWIYAGWYGGMMMQPAKLSLELTFVETANPSNIVLQMTGNQINTSSRNEDLRWEYGRIAGAYKFVGKKLGSEIKSHL